MRGIAIGIGAVLLVACGGDAASDDGGTPAGDGGARDGGGAPEIDGGGAPFDSGGTMTDSGSTSPGGHYFPAAALWAVIERAQ